MKCSVTSKRMSLACPSSRLTWRIFSSTAQAPNEDFGLEQITGNSDDRYKFRTSPLRNVALQPAFFHNGAFTRLKDAVRHHLDVFQLGALYDPVRAGVAPDLAGAPGPLSPFWRRSTRCSPRPSR